MSSVKVFNFTLFNIATNENHLSPSMTTLPVIRRLGGELALPETGVEVDRSRLDGNGMIRREFVSVD